MKKLFAVLLSVLLLLSLTACGTINDANVAVLWSDGDHAVSPYSLINSMDRAMYIQNIGYDHYGAKGEQATQLEQAQTALDGGCSALLVEMVEADAAQQIVDMAKAKNVPVIFFNCAVADTVVASYDKCYAVKSDEATITTVQDEMIAEYYKAALKSGFLSKPKDVDRNKDGKLNFVKFGEIETSIKTGDKVYEESELVYEEISLEMKDLDPEKVELIITADDKLAMEALLALQAKDFNTDKLATQFVPIFTVNNEADYKGYVMKDAPTEVEALEKYIKENKEYFESNRFLVDITAVKAKDIGAMIYTTSNIIDDGRISGTAMADYDAISENVAKLTANLMKGNDAAKGIEGLENRTLKISYTDYAAK